MRTNENGRSMVEMLGVLAIIGILSVTGIYGYSIAMRKYRANEIVQAASMLAIIAQSADSGEGECIDLTKSGLPSNIAGINVDMVAEPTPGTITVRLQIKDLDNDEIDALCNTIDNTVGKNGTYEIDPCGGDDVTSCSEIGV